MVLDDLATQDALRDLFAGIAGNSKPAG